MAEANILKGEVREYTGKSYTKLSRKEGNEYFPVLPFH